MNNKDNTNSSTENSINSKNSIKSISDKIIEFELEDITIFKTIHETLANIVSEINWVLQNNKKFIGLEIRAQDTSRIFFTKIKVKKEHFKTFEMNKEKYSLGINLIKLKSFLKDIDKKIPVKIYLKNDDLLNIIIETKKNDNRKKQYSMGLINLEENNNTIEDTEYEKK